MYRACMHKNNSRIKDILNIIRKNRNWYYFVIPGIAFYIIFRFVPLYFIQIAFKDFRITLPVSDCPWAGFKYFEQLFSAPGFWNAFKNTLIISTYKLVIGFPFPIILALLLNDIINTRFKRITQSIIYLPHFISWVILGGIIMNMLAVDGGIINELRLLVGLEPVNFIGKPEYFRSIIVWSSVWKVSGWGTIIYMSALTQIKQEMYESAMIDGANRLQQTWYITLPGIKETIIVLLILRLGNLLNVGFEQVLVLMNEIVKPVGDILDTYVYRTGLLQSRYSYAVAAGLFKSVIAAFMLFASDRFAKKLGERGLF